MIRGIRIIVGVIMLVGIVYLVVNYAGTVKETMGVKGINTQRKADEVSRDIQNDFNKEITTVASKTGEVTVSDIVNTISRFQKIPQDISSISAYIQDKIRNVTSKK